MGIRQQSLSHHLPTKRAILEELLGFTLNEPLRVVQNMRASVGSPAARLYAYVRFDVAHLLSSTYTLQGIFGRYLLEDPALVKWYESGSDLDDAVATIVAEGIAVGEFRTIDQDYAAGAVGGLVEQTFNVFGPYGVKPDVPFFVADFCLSALLRDNSMLDRVRHEAESIDPTEAPAAP